MPNKNNTKKNNKRNNTKKNNKNNKSKKNNYKPAATSLCGPCPQCNQDGYIVGTTGMGNAAICECASGHRWRA